MTSLFLGTTIQGIYPIPEQIKNNIRATSTVFHSNMRKKEKNQKQLLYLYGFLLSMVKDRKIAAFH
jgi:hypothetical protein